MNFFNFLKGQDINTGVKQFESTPNAILLDVRTQDEYGAGRIPGSRNIPLDQLDKVPQEIPDHSTPLFVYCLSGARSSRATAMLQSMGYEAITNIGGISNYRGTMES